MPGMFNTPDPENEETEMDNGIDEDEWIEISWEDDSTSLTQPKTQTLKIQAQAQNNLNQYQPSPEYLSFLLPFQFPPKSGIVMALQTLTT